MIIKKKESGRWKMAKLLPFQIVVLSFPGPYKIIFKDKARDQYLNRQPLQAEVE
jgi:hypothetical protein